MKLKASPQIQQNLRLIIELIERISNTTFIFIQIPHEHISCGQHLRPLGQNRENNSHNSDYFFFHFLSMVSKSTSHIQWP